ncbi:MAG: cell division protein FtsB [Candidatus Schmidhempelia sp.]|nr:cell division protein FtsB [Candidatus Schmidhempelia sp.]
MKWKLTTILLLILVYLQYSLWFGKNNVNDYRQMSQLIKEMQVQNAKLKQRNDRMYAEITDLYDGLEAIEERARTSLGMIRPNEHFYRIIIESGQE